MLEARSAGSIAPREGTAVLRLARTFAQYGALMAAVVSLRLAAPGEDFEFLSALARDPAVEPYLAPGRGEPTALAELAGPPSEPPQGVYLIDTPPGRPVGGLALTVVNRRSRICDLSRVMLTPDAHGAGIAVEAARLMC